MFEQALADFPEIETAGSVMIGDSHSDMEFGKRLGMRTVFIEVDAGRQGPGAELAREMADMRCGSLLEAVKGLLEGAL